MGLMNALRRIFRKKPQEVKRPEPSVRFDDLTGLTARYLLYNSIPATQQTRNYYSEKRRFGRLKDRRDIYCYPLSSLPVKAELMDASLGGLRIKAKEMIQINTNMGVAFYLKGELSSFLVKVLWESKSNEEYEYGLEFSKNEGKCNKYVVSYLNHLKCD
jgi:hypothetical protein